MKIAIAQLNYTVGAVQSNKLKIINSIYKAREAGVDLVVFAENAISGTYCYDLQNKAPFLESCEVALVEIASHCEGICAVIGLPVQDLTENKTLSAAAFIRDRRVMRYVTKKSVVSRDEMGFIYPGTGPAHVMVGEEKMAIVVGEDIHSYYKLGASADVTVMVASSHYFRDKIAFRYETLGSYAYMAGKPMVMVNQMGGQSDVIFDGSSCAFDRHGKPIAFLGSFVEDMTIIDTSVAGTAVQPEQDKIANVYNALKLGIKDYFEKNGFHKACLGLSGGIDSAVVLAMAVDALGSDNVRVLMMPSQFSSDHSVNDAVEMAENLGVEYDVIPIEESYRVITESLKPVIGGTSFDVTEENVQARIRCVMLMALANKHRCILLNTSNKSEATMGYGTLYGDLAGSLSVIGDLYKIEVYALARYLNRHRTVIPQNIITKEPSAELRPGQKDGDSLPPYEVLDAIVYRFVEEGQGVDDIINAGFDDRTVHFIIENMKYNTYKRRQCCPALRVSKCPYEVGLKLPLLNKYIL